MTWWSNLSQQQRDLTVLIGMPIAMIFAIIIAASDEIVKVGAFAFAFHVLLILIGWASWRAFKIGRIYTGGNEVNRQDQPIAFWSHLAIALIMIPICAVLSLGFDAWLLLTWIGAL